MIVMKINREFLFVARLTFSCLLFLSTLSACQTVRPVVSAPGNGLAFDASPDKFTFALFSDLNGGERDGVFDVAAEQLALLSPEFILSVGDLVGSGGKEKSKSKQKAEVEQRWDVFEQRSKKTGSPVFYVTGNHDLSSEAAREVWESRFGSPYYHFLYKDVLFLVLNTEDTTLERAAEIEVLRKAAIPVYEQQGMEGYEKTEHANIPENLAGSVSTEQADYFVDVIESNPNVRWIFLMMHKAPWTNPDGNAFARIEDALLTHSYTVFHGHRHRYEYTLRNGHDYIQLATTGGIQLTGEYRSMDHIMLVTVDDDGVDIANLLLSGILDKTGKIPANGESLCFEKAVCGSE